MIIGVDFDNTIVRYDALFHRVALERGLIPETVEINKNAVRDYLRTNKREPEWTALQGEVYGPRMSEAECFPGVLDFFRACRETKIPLFIISHKTRTPIIGEAHDLHAAARAWLESRGFFSPEVGGLTQAQVFFELTKTAKLARIGACACTHFIDDLPEILNDPAFPAAVERFLFATNTTNANPKGLHCCSNWTDLRLHLLPRSPAGQSRQMPPPLQPAQVASLAVRCGRSVPTALEALTGGANNRVFRARTANKEDFVIKQYFTSGKDPRDRFTAERDFFHFAWDQAGARCLPEPLGWDENEHLAAFSLIDGAMVETCTPADIDAALAFFTTLNKARTVAVLPLASEACFTLREHLETVDRRLARLQNIEGTLPIDEQARAFVRDELSPAWTELRNDPAWRERLAKEHSAPQEQLPRCISPSDFGFHNTLRRPDGQLVFFDFEYAGWDDPAKLVCDFFSQPAVPVPLSALQPFIRKVSAALDCAGPEALTQRCAQLLPVYQIKWCTILLNEFLTTEAQRRQFSTNDDAASRKARQLAKAVAALQKFKASSGLPERTLQNSGT